MATGGGRYWQVVLSVAVALILIPSTTPQGEWREGHTGALVEPY